MMQTAENLKKGEQTLSGGIYVISQDHYDENPDGDQIPGLDIMYRRGLGDRSDLGVYFSPALTGGHLRTDFKYNVFKSTDEKRYLSTLISLEAEHLLNNPYMDERRYIGTGLGLIFSMNHENSIVPFFYQRATFGWNNLDVLRNPASDYSYHDYNIQHHRMEYIGGIGIMMKSKRSPRLQFFADASYSIRRMTLFEVKEYAHVEDYYLTKSQMHRLNLQLVFGVTVSLGE
jgi:hypothetical protein